MSEVESEQEEQEELESSDFEQSEYPDRADEPAKSTFAVEAPPLCSRDELQTLQTGWDEIQTGFVDRPRDAVHDADKLVSFAMQRLSEVFTAERSKLEQQWDRGDIVSTEDLRVALQRYRSFFRRVLSL